MAVSAVLLATAADAGVPQTPAIPPTPATPAVAAQPPPPGARRLTQFPSRVASARTVEPASIVAPSQELALERGKGILLHLPRPAATIFVADPDLVDFQTKSASLVYVFGKATGETVIYAADAGGEVLYAGRVRVTQNLSGIRDALARALPNEPITVTDTGGAVMLSGLVLSAAHAADAAAIARQFVDAKKNEIVLNMLTVAEAAQVNLRVRVAEVNRTVLKSIGINWDAVANSGRFAFGLMTQNPATFAELFTRNKITVKNGNVNAMIDALAQEGLITLLAQPNLTALSGETASFLAGGEFPVPVAATAGSGSVPTITIEFKKFGVSLDFTPTVIDGNRINLRVRPEVSQLSTSGGVQLQGFSVPGLTVRRAETTVELGSGETFVIAGLLQRTSDNTLSKIPGAGDIPVIGALLRSSRYRRAETELAIIVTPYLVRPLSSPALAAAPTDGLVEANDIQRVFGGKFYQPHAPGAPTPAGGPQ
ncbi:MAG: type II and III secretion system protein family protein [Sphingomonadaceae bacterium]|nr:type II and III secretion system protein family protein [Sphingomonadaceae bacterium]